MTCLGKCKFCGKPAWIICDDCVSIQVALERDPAVIGKVAEEFLTEGEIDNLICSLRDAREAAIMKGSKSHD